MTSIDARTTSALVRLLLAVAILAGSIEAFATDTASAADGKARDGKAGQRQRDRVRRSGEVAIVVLDDGADPRAAAREMGVVPVRVYTNVFSGFAADLSTAVMARSSRGARVKAIAPDSPMSATGEVVPTGVQRIGQAEVAGQATAESARKDKQSGKNGKKTKKRKSGKKSNKAKKDRKDKKDQNGENEQPVDAGSGADVAILDSGVTASPDLPLAGGVSCLENRPTCSGSSYADLVGHGTHVAGIVAARDNDLGVVGVDPTARIWAVRVLARGSNGAAVGWVSDVIAGLDWVYQRRGTIDVVNMSLGGWMNDAGGPDDAYRLAIKRVADAGIPVVVAAGNAGQDVPDNGTGRQWAPAVYPETIAVSAFADSDGRPGGAGGKTCSGDLDDTFWAYSNRGSAVDIAAPGVCILSLTPRGETVEMSGTSMAAPHVAGALAIHAAANPGASEAQARDWLRSVASSNQSGPFGFGGDPDGDREPVLRLGP